MCCPGLWFPHFGSKGATGPFLGPQELCGPGGMALPSGSGWCTWGTWAGSDRGSLSLSSCLRESHGQVDTDSCWAFPPQGPQPLTVREERSVYPCQFGAATPQSDLLLHIHALDKGPLHMLKVKKDLVSS